MIVKQKQARLLFSFVTLLLTLSLTIAGCGGTPTPKPPPTFDLEVSPGTEVQVGKRVVIVAEIEPVEKLNLKWSVSGTAEGTLNTDTGEQVIYTAGKEGTDIVVAEGTTASGVSIKQTVTLKVMGGAMAETPIPTPTSPPTSTSSESKIYCTDSGGGGTETLPVEPPRTVARIRIDMEQRATEYGDSLWEVEAYGPDTGNTNLVTGGEARASSEQDSYGCEGCFADQAIDGDMTTRWSSDWYDPQWLEITIPDPQVVNCIVLKWEIAYARQYCVTVIGPVIPSTPTPVSPTATLSPSPEATPAVAPTPECQSFRPRLTGAADFAGDVEIKTPANCTTGLPTETSITVAGTYEGIPDDVDIWVLAYPSNLVYYVQSPNACEGEKMRWGNGTWQIPVYLGARGGDPEWFDIVVVLVDQETSHFFSDWGRQGCQSGQYLGIPAAQLEQMNITEKGYITVQTLD